MGMNSLVNYRLEENYEIAEAVCIPRSTLYCHYLDYCETNDTQPVNAASFGKVGRGWGCRIHFYSNSFSLQGFSDLFICISIWKCKCGVLFLEKLRSKCYFGLTTLWSDIRKFFVLLAF